VITKFFILKASRERPTPKALGKLEDNIKVDLKEIGWKDWIHLTQGRNQEGLCFWSLFFRNTVGLLVKHKLCYENIKLPLHLAVGACRPDSSLLSET
jgi:hypothetical protein